MKKLISLLFAVGLILLGCILPAYSHATSFSVNGVADTFGQFPTIGYGLALNSDKDILPVGPNGFGLFGLFDTGSTLVAINDSGSGLFGNDDAFFLGLNATTNVDVRINGLGATTQATATNVTQDITSGGAEADVQGILAAPRNVNVTLIGAPVANQVTAVIDYTTQITRTLSAGNLIAPDIMFNPSGPLMSEVELTLERFGSTDPSSIDGATQGQRYYMRGVSFNEGSNSQEAPLVGDLLPASENRFLYDTGTNVTLISESIATALGLLGPADFTGLVGGNTLDGYFLDSIEMMGVGGTYTVLNAAVFVDPNTVPFGGAADAIIGSNLFDQTSLLFDGPGNILGVGVSSAAPVPEPATMLLLGTGLVGVAGAARKRKKDQA